MSIAPGKIVTQDRDLNRVDGWLMDPGAIPADTNVPFELEMKCYEPTAWQQTVHQNNEGNCIDIQEICDREVREAREEYLKCLALCATAYCQSVCNTNYQKALQDIFDQYGCEP